MQTDFSTRSPAGASAADLALRWVVSGAGLALLLVATFLKPSGPPAALPLGAALIVVLFVAWQIQFPLHLLGDEVYLFQAVSLGSGLVLGPAVAGWASLAGIVLGLLGRMAFARLPASTRRAALPAPGLTEIAFTAGRLLLPLLALLLVSQPPLATTPLSSAPMSSAPMSSAPSLALDTLARLILFAALHAALIWAPSRLRPPSRLLSTRRDLYWLALIELMPLPFVLMAVLAYPLLGAVSLLGLGSVPLIFAILLNGMDQTRHHLERRVQELSLLQQVSQVLRTTLELEAVLGAIHTQVTRLLGVDNFYVALYEQETGELWYPLAVKHGQRRAWAPRPLENRLTERVILERRPILLGLHSENTLRAELPPSEETPTSWIGVPLISSERVIGCLALFSLSSQVGFTPADLDVLTTLSGQISVGIENALLYNQAQRRAAQLENLNRISTLITASLEPQEVLAQVCRAAVQVISDSRSAIYLLDEGQGEANLAYALGLSSGFAGQNAAFSVADSERARCLRTGHPEISTGLGPAYAAEGIAAYASFPLVTPEGQTGILAVYSGSPHAFSGEEVDLLQTFATQAALAVANSRRYARTDLALSQRAGQLSILEAVGRQLAGAIHSDSLFEMILTYAREFTDSRWGWLGLYDPQTGVMHPRSVHGYPHPLPSFPAGQDLSGQALRSLSPLRSGDVLSEAAYVDLTGGQARSLLCVPLVYEGRILGALTLEKTEPDGYSESDAAFITQLANQAAVAVVNAELYADMSASRDRLAAVLNSVQEGILMVDRSGRILLANRQASRFTGLPLDELESARFDRLPEAVLHRLGCSAGEARGWSEALERGEVPEILRQVVDAGRVEGAAGPEVMLERSILPVWARSGRPSGWMVVLRDVTEEFEIARARELLTATLVHDLRSPLSAVLGALEMMADPSLAAGSGEPYRQAHKVAQRSARRVLGLVESLLDISRLESGEMEMDLQPVDLAALVEAALADFRAQAQDFSIRLEAGIQPGLPPILGDESKLARVLANLLDNAIKFTPNGGEVRVSAERAGGELRVAVSDSGPGVPEEYRETIFERFVQAPGLPGRRRGSGLGLTFCRLAVQAHGGRIWVEPRPGGGSRFIFTLPAAS